MFDSIREYFSKVSSTLKTVRLVLFDNETTETFLRALETDNG
jgi:hypothetical protein